jgi:DNA-binding XRE family transcriptional regulator
MEQHRTTSRQAATLNRKMVEDEDNESLNPDIVDQIFDEFDEATNSLIKDWTKNVNWADGDDFLAWLRLKKLAKRNSALDKLVPDRVCPRCGNKEIRNIYWRIDKYYSEAMCLSCHSSQNKFQTTNSKFYPGYDEWEIVLLIRKVFVRPVARFEVDGKNLEQMRRMLGIPRATLAKEIDVAPVTISLLESGEVRTMLQDKVLLCLKVFKEYFMKRLRECGYTDQELERHEWHEPQIEEID